MNTTYHHENVDESDVTLNAILDIIVEGTWDWRSETGHVDRSPGWYRMLGYDIHTFKKNVFTWENIIHPDDYERVMKHFENYINGLTDTYCIEYRCRKSDETYIWIVDRGKVIERNPDGSVARMIGAHNNIHKQKMAQIELVKQNQLLQEGNITLEKVISRKADELEKKNHELEFKINQIETLSNTDPLTKVHNRKKFEEELQKEILRCKRYGHSLSFTIFDVDYFKHINDTYGHKVGDSVLQNITKVIASSIREVDFFGRWGGDEFVLIYPDTPLEKAFLITEKLRKRIREEEIKPGLFVACSFGLVEYCGSDEISDLFQKADKALYTAKDHGRNRVVASPVDI